MSVSEALAILDADDAATGVWSQPMMMNGHERTEAEHDYLVAVLREIAAGRAGADLAATAVARVCG